jgi:Uma2 family endonuclease
MVRPVHSPQEHPRGDEAVIAMATETRLYTVDDLARFPDDGVKRELVAGQIVEWGMSNWLHGYFIALLSYLLQAYVLEHELGAVVAGDPFVRIQGSERDARGPDVAFYARGRIPADMTAAATATCPDLVIEVLSPSDRAADVERKVDDWLRAGVRLLWYINPETGTTTEYYRGGVTRLPATTALDAKDVVPGFTLRIQAVLDRVASLKERRDGP